MKSNEYKQLHNENEALLEYCRANILNLIDFTSEISAQMFLLIRALINKGIFTEEEINKIINKENVNMIIGQIDSQINDK